MQHSIVLLTGASRGIGSELAKLCAKDGHHVILVARGEKELEKIAAELRSAHQCEVTVLAKDLSKPHAAEEIAQWLHEKNVQVDILINNAGFATYGNFAESDLTREQMMMQVNMTTLVSLTRLLLPEMIRRRSGKILNVASTAAFQPGPLMSVYYATKAFVLSFSHAIANELQGTGVTVTCLCPGPTATGFQREAKMEDSMLFDLGAMDPARVARAGYRGMMRGKRLVIPGTRNRMGAFFVRFVPLGMAANIVRRLQQKRTV